MGERTGEMSSPVRAGESAGATPRVIARPEAEIRGGAGGGESVEEIQAQIEQTRAEMGETIAAIQEKLSPERLREQMREAVRATTVRRAEHMMESAERRARNARSTLVETVRENPLPAALAGIGIGWLLMSMRESGRVQPRYARPGYPQPYYTAETRGRQMAGGAGERMQAMTSQAQEQVGRVVGDVQEKSGEMVSQAREQVGRVASEAQASAAEMVDQAREQADELRWQTQYQVERTTDRLQEMVYENPLAAGVLALAVGAAVGLAIPETRKESELMGEAREAVMERAQETAAGAMAKVQRVAEEAQRAARREAEEQGLGG